MTHLRRCTIFIVGQKCNSSRSISFVGDREDFCSVFILSRTTLDGSFDIFTRNIGFLCFLHRFPQSWIETWVGSFCGSKCNQFCMDSIHFLFGCISSISFTSDDWSSSHSGKLENKSPPVYAKGSIFQDKNQKNEKSAKKFCEI